MRSGERFPADQAEIVFSDEFVEQLEGLDPPQAQSVLESVVGLCVSPSGSHPLHAPLAGWNTLEVLRRSRRVVYHARIVDGAGTIDVLCLGPRSNSEVYDVARGLRDAGLLSDEIVTQIWEALILLDVIVEDVGLDEWDYLPEAAPEGMRRAAEAAGVLPPDMAQLLSKKELEAALEYGWSEDGTADPERALVAALILNRRSPQPDLMEVIRRCQEHRCGAVMPRARRACIRRKGHPGPHRAR